ncbi:leucine-rich repeat domain-containing protein [Allomuricauda taeanensis]|uniref:leucine-rich repeat domain-containing protein n=1 Tax=Flagellimonas taeanensis TaxID=1005926 RepID=UPI002E7B9A85|nr:leucine-rich repeat domain-containing protein [Allomuricauda taeanensis]MEE1964612.1 leucine-rich repeat domain-containing protein [Allomuricauda taeanensis]
MKKLKMKKGYYGTMIVWSALWLVLSCSTDDGPASIAIDSLSFSGIAAEQENLTLALGDSLQLTVDISPSDASNQDLVWSSSSPEVAAVAQDGTVKGLQPGETVIAVRAEDASKTEAEITLRVLDTNNAITSFMVNGNNATIIGNAIGFAFPADSDVDLSKLAPVIEHTGVAVDPDSGAEQDFTDPVEYTVTAENGATKTYTVTIEKGLKSTNSITSFKVNGNEATIDGDAISFTFPAGSDVDLAKLAPVIEHTGLAVDPDSGEEQNFTNPVEYTVTAENGDTKTYTVTIEKGLKSSNSITSFKVNGNEATIDGDAIGFTFPAGSGADLTKLKPEIVHTGKSIAPDSGVEQNFTNPVEYTVTAENGATKTYTVTIDIALTAVESDRAALMAIYNASPEAQDGLTGWGSEQPLNDWLGVTTNAEGRVIKIRLSNKVLKVLPTEVGNLTKLESLNLSSNELTSIPAEIGNLTALEYLYLDDNKLETIPTEIWGLTKLKSLNLSSNELTSIPAEIENLTALEYLYLSSNELKSIPAEIRGLRALESLSLNNNELKSIPAAEIGNLTKLKRLGLQDNYLTSIPASIGNLTKLESLDLSSNELTSIPAEIGNLTALNIFWLHDNSSLTSIPASVCTLGNSLGSGFRVDAGLCE